MLKFVLTVILKRPFLRPNTKSSKTVPILAASRGAKVSSLLLGLCGNARMNFVQRWRTGCYWLKAWASCSSNRSGMI